MSQFLENAREIFEAAENTAAVGEASSEYTILVGSPRSGQGIHMVANSDWSLSALQSEHGAHLAYRVSRANGRVIVDGRDGQRTCHMEAPTANNKALFLLNSVVPSAETTALSLRLLAA